MPPGCRASCPRGRTFSFDSPLVPGQSLVEASSVATASQPAHERDRFASCSLLDPRKEQPCLRGDPIILGAGRNETPASPRSRHSRRAPECPQREGSGRLDETPPLDEQHQRGHAGPIRPLRKYCLGASATSRCCARRARRSPYRLTARARPDARCLLLPMQSGSRPALSLDQAQDGGAKNRPLRLSPFSGLFLPWWAVGSGVRSLAPRSAEPQGS